MKIMPAEWAQIGIIMGFARMMHQESRYCVLERDDEKLENQLLWCMNDENGLLLVAMNDDERVIGAFAGYAAQHWISDDLCAGDFGLFVDPDERVKGAGGELLCAYVEWAKTKGCKIIDAGISLKKPSKKLIQLYDSVGFEHIGELFEFRGS